VLNTPHTDEHEQAETLRVRLAEAEEMLRAIRHGEIDALIVEGADGSQVYTLHSADEPYRNLVEQMQSGALVLTAHGEVLYANAHFAALVGEPLQSVSGSRFDRFVHAQDRDDVAALLDAGSGRRRCRLLGPDSRPCEVSLSLTTTRAAAGERRNLIVTDMTELLEALSDGERAARASRTKDEFLALVAHELRNPLGAIGTAVQVLTVTPPEGSTAVRARDVIARQIDHITRLVDDLIDIERVVSGKLRLNRQRHDIEEVVRRAVAAIAAGAGLDRRFEVSTEPAWIDGDAVRIEQVLTNLLTNAVKYTRAGGRIQVMLRVDGADAVMSVADSGFGISRALLPYIFDMYVQADETIDRARGGLGIGLALVRRLVELHEGTVAASSDGEGHGSTFTVRLRRMPAPDTSSGVQIRQERRAKPRRVLLIEDSGEARETLRTMLELAGHEVYGTADVAAGIALVTAVRPDVAIIDVDLPVMDGYQVARRIREEPLGRGMLLLALAGRGAAAGDSSHSLAHGFDYHLVQPVDAAYLARLISETVTAS
jgi:signal transduction histidine kinase/ActR/RegA family two-component response regulator